MSLVLAIQQHFLQQHQGHKTTLDVEKRLKKLKVDKGDWEKCLRRMKSLHERSGRQDIATGLRGSMEEKSLSLA